MRKFLKLVLLASSLALLGGSSFAQERGTADEAVALVKSAVAYYNKHGQDKLVEEVNNPNSTMFKKKDLYIFVGYAKDNTPNLAHGGNPKMVGKDLSKMTDADGQPFVQKILDTALSKEGKGWVDYKWPDPITKKIDAKSTYVEKVGPLMIGCGIYK